MRQPMIGRMTERQIVTKYGVLDPGIPNEFKDAGRVGWGVSINEDWIMRGNERMLWIPMDNRILALDALRSIVAFGDTSGDIAIMRLK
jgi:hypothetical protein